MIWLPANRVKGFPMPTGLIIFGLIIVFILGGLLALRANARLPLPKNLPPPLLNDGDENDK
jgi:hypothetical protein